MNLIKNIEKAKTSLLVVLFSITILLLYFLWGNHALSKKLDNSQNATVSESNELEVEKFFRPFRARIHFGGNNYTVLYTGLNDIWDAYVESLNKFNHTENVYVEEINEEEWKKVLDYQSVKFDFGYDIPFDAVKKMIKLIDTPGDGRINFVSEISYSNAYRNSHFVFDEINNKYYRIISDQEHTKILDEISKIEKRNYDKYDPIKNYFDVDNNNLMPYALKNRMEVAFCEKEIQHYESGRINSLAEKFFGESFDFVRKIIETNGTVIFMYGYGQKMLIVSDKGYLEYKEEIDIENHEDMDYVEALSIGSSYVTNHGNWKTLKGTEIYPYLKESKEITQSNQKGYHFTFGYKINGYPVCYEKDEAIEVRVIGHQVTYYKRFLLDQKDTLQFLINEDNENANSNIIRTHKIITDNYEAIKEIYIENGYDFSNMVYEEIFSEIVKNIRRVDVSYYLKGGIEEAENIKLIPSWVFTTSQFRMHFSIESGMPLGWKSLQ